MVKTRVNSLRGVEGRNARDQKAWSNKKWCFLKIIIIIIKPTNFEPFSVTPDSCLLWQRQVKQHFFLSYVARGDRWRRLYSEKLVYGGKFVFQKRLGRPYSWKEIYRFCFVLLYKIEGNFHGGLCFEGRFNGGHLSLWVWGAYIWKGLYMEGLIFGILRYVIA